MFDISKRARAYRHTSLDWLIWEVDGNLVWDQPARTATCRRCFSQVDAKYLQSHKDWHTMIMKDVIA